MDPETQNEQTKISGRVDHHNIVLEDNVLVLAKKIGEVIDSRSALKLYGHL